MNPAASTGAEPDLGFLKLAGEFERHLRFVIVDQWSAGSWPTSRLSSSQNLPAGEVCSIRYLLAIDGQGASATFAKAAAIIFEVEIDRMLAWRELLLPISAGTTPECRTST
jgi:hypothetical protein